MIPDLSVLWVIALLMLCVFVLNTLIFRPILHVSESRARAVREARELAASAASKATEASANFDRTLGAARAEVYRQMDDARRTRARQARRRHGRDQAAKSKPRSVTPPRN